MIYDQYLVHLYAHDPGPTTLCPKCPPPPPLMPYDSPWPLIDQITLEPPK
jgi:hypothetical protein